MRQDCLVTGAFGYSGKYIAQRLLAQGKHVKTLTNSVARDNPFGGAITAEPFHFDDPDAMRRSMDGFKVLINTYWVRFNHNLFNHADAVENTLKLFQAAKAAGVERVIHVSITNPSIDSELEYFNGKARLEQALIDSGMSYAILRPTVLFGPEDILINNIAWVVRHFPVFPVFGDGRYRLQPIHVDDLAKLAVEQIDEEENRIINAIGPETFTFRELVLLVAKTLEKSCRVLPCNPTLSWLAGKISGLFVGDVIVTREEIKGLMQDLLYVDDEPAGQARLSEWLRSNPAVGSKYSSELARRRNRLKAY